MFIYGVTLLDSKKPSPTERERARSNIENFEQYQSASFPQCFVFGFAYILRQDVRGYDIRARLCGLRVNFFRDQLKGSVWQLGRSEVLMALHLRTCHMCLCLFW